MMTAARFSLPKIGIIKVKESEEAERVRELVLEGMAKKMGIRISGVERNRREGQRARKMK